MDVEAVAALGVPSNVGIAIGRHGRQRQGGRGRERCGATSGGSQQGTAGPGHRDFVGH